MVLSSNKCNQVTRVAVHQDPASSCKDSIKELFDIGKETDNVLKGTVTSDIIHGNRQPTPSALR